MGAVEPGGRRRLAADLAEPDHDSRCTVGSWLRLCDNRQQLLNYFAMIRYSPLQKD
jgi:hypothetical protein